MTMKKILIDSDVCLDSITARHPWAEEADRLLQAVEDKEVAGVVSAESFSNMFYILRKFSSGPRAIDQLKKLRSIVEVGTLNTATVDRALSSGWTDFEDALQWYCAEEANCDLIITRNTPDYSEADLPTMTPAEFLAMIHN